ncbi:MAG: hypothetical protein V8R61_09585 [Enterocloster sp.]
MKKKWGALALAGVLGTALLQAVRLAERVRQQKIRLLQAAGKCRNYH